MQITVEELTWAERRKDNDYCNTVEKKVLTRRWCREVVFNKLGKIRITEDDWFQWRGAMVCSGYFTDDEIENRFLGNPTTIRRGIALDHDKRKDQWVDNEAWLMKLLKEAGHSYTKQQPTTAAETGKNPAVAALEGSGVFSIRPNICRHCGGAL